MHLENCAIAIRFKRKIYVDKRILKKAVKSDFGFLGESRG